MHASDPAIGALARLPQWVILAVLAVLMIVGIAVRGVVGAVAFGLVTAFLAWLLYLSWQQLRPLDRLARDLLAALLDRAPEGACLIAHPAGRPCAEHDHESVAELARQLDRRRTVERRDRQPAVEQEAGVGHRVENAREIDVIGALHARSGVGLVHVFLHGTTRYA